MGSIATLPRSEAGESGIGHLSSGDAPPLYFHPQIFLAEDDRELRDLVSEILRSHGYDVIELVSGLDLYNHLGECLFSGAATPDVIVSDLRMPDFSGLEALGSVRSTELNIPFILMTAYGDEDTRTAALRAGAAAVLDKPFDVDDLLNAVARSTPLDRWPR